MSKRFFAVTTTGSYIYINTKGFIEVIPRNSATYPNLKNQKLYSEPNLKLKVSSH